MLSSEQYEFHGPFRLHTSVTIAFLILSASRIRAICSVPRRSARCLDRNAIISRKLHAVECIDVHIVRINSSESTASLSTSADISSFSSRSIVSLEYLYQNSRIYIRYIQQLLGILVENTGCPCLPFLLTPIQNPQTEEIAYNMLFKRTRQIVERTFGIWKLSKGLTNKLICSTTIVIACAVLHNLSLIFNELRRRLTGK
ncbi:hypothetical protein P5V15_011412 [Pogonomyrmex californicus]